MSEYVIVTDSAADLSDEMVKELGVEVLPLSFLVGDKSYHNSTRITGRWTPGSSTVI